MALKIALANQKGGVAKTSTVIGLCDYLEREGRRVLAVDCDPQISLTMAYGAKTEDEYTLYDLYKGECDEPHDLIQQTEFGDIIPCDKALSGQESTFISGPQAVSNFHVLRKAFAALDDEYDFIICDCGPAFGFYMTSVLLAVDGVIIPINAGKFAIEGLSDMLKAVNSAKEINKSLRIFGILQTFYDKRQSLDKDVVEALPELSNRLGIPLLNVSIRKCQAIANAQYSRKRISESYAKSNAALDYKALADLFIKGGF